MLKEYFGKEDQLEQNDVPSDPLNLKDEITSIDLKHDAGKVVDVALALDERNKKSWVKTTTEACLGTLDLEALEKLPTEEQEQFKMSLADNLFYNGFQLPNFSNLLPGSGKHLSQDLCNITGLSVQTYEGENLKEFMVQVGERMLETLHKKPD